MLFVFYMYPATFVNIITSVSTNCDIITITLPHLMSLFEQTITGKFYFISFSCADLIIHYNRNSFIKFAGVSYRFY